jgi:hypothetical protein
VLTVIGCSVTAPAFAAGAPEISVLGQGPVAVNAVQGENRAEAYVTVLNSGSVLANISASFQAASAGSTKAELANPTTIQPGQAARVKLVFTGLKALGEVVSGDLVITGGAKPVAQSVEITPALQPSATLAHPLRAGIPSQACPLGSVTVLIPHIARPALLASARLAASEAQQAATSGNRAFFPVCLLPQDPRNHAVCSVSGAPDRFSLIRRMP